MYVRGTAGNDLSGLVVNVKDSGNRPDYSKTAPMLLERCRGFYQDPENERAFQEWKARKEARHEKAV